MKGGKKEFPVYDELIHRTQNLENNRSFIRKE